VKWSLLVVEDDPVELELTLAGLSKYPDVEVQSASDGVDALNQLRNPAPADGSMPAPKVILMDVQMPRLSGIETVRLLRAQPHTKQTPIVMFSNSDDPRDIEAAYLAGANGYLRKPSTSSASPGLFDSLVGFWLQHNLTAKV
jgi:two-component system response regulator